MMSIKKANVDYKIKYNLKLIILIIFKTIYKNTSNYDKI